jgi:hypothetical protein
VRPGVAAKLIETAVGDRLVVLQKVRDEHGDLRPLYCPRGVDRGQPEALLAQELAEPPGQETAVAADEIVLIFEAKRLEVGPELTGFSPGFRQSI